MKKYRKALAGMLFFMILVLSQPVFAKAGLINYFRYKGWVCDDDDEPSCIYNYKGKKRSIVVPEQIRGSDIDRIESLKGAKKLKKLRLSSKIRYAYLSDAPVLEKISISKKNQYLSVKNNVLYNKEGTVLLSCPGGRLEVKVPDRVKTIDYSAFYKAKVRKVRLGKNVTCIGTCAFKRCRNLTVIKWNSKLEEISTAAFKYCTALESISLPRTVKCISDCAFEGCKNLRKVTFEGDALKEIWGFAFENCENLEEIHLEQMEHAPKIKGGSYSASKVFSGTKPGIRFYVKNETVAAQLKKRLFNTGVTDANIYVGDKLIYEKVN